MNLLLRWLISALSVIAAAYIVPGVSIANTWTALMVALIIGLINALIRPLILLLTLPVNILTLGLFTFVINALMFWLASSIVKGFDVVDFKAAFFGALVFWLVSWLVNGLLGSKK
ncbi:MAG: phage holin family protein [Patescibacteria group bacterium]